MDDRSPPAFRIERRIFAGIGVFLIPWLIIYVSTEYEDAGALLLGLCAVSLLLLAGFLFYAARGLLARPSDRRDARPPEHVEHEPHVMSIWPLTIGGAATLLALGAALSVWVLVPGVLLLVFAIVGFVRELG